MPSIPIIMPQLGESIAEATVVNLLVAVGDHMETDQDIIEVETSKATMNVASPCPGRVERFLVKPGESYAVGAVLGYLEASEEDAARLGLDAPPPDGGAEEVAKTVGAGNSQAGGAEQGVQPTVRGLPVPANAAGASYMSPRMKARMVELGLHAADLAGLPGQRRRRTRHHPGFREVRCATSRAQAQPGLQHARSRRRCDAAQLDPAAGDRRAARLFRSVAEPPQDVQSEARPGAVCASRAGVGTGRKQRPGGAAHREQDCPPDLD